MTRSTWTSARIKDSGTKKFSMNSHTPSPFSRKKPKFSLGKGFCQSIISNCQLSNRVTIPCPSVFSLDLSACRVARSMSLDLGMLTYSVSSVLINYFEFHYKPARCVDSDRGELTSHCRNLTEQGLEPGSPRLLIHAPVSGKGPEAEGRCPPPTALGEWG